MKPGDEVEQGRVVARLDVQAVAVRADGARGRLCGTPAAAMPAGARWCARTSGVVAQEELDGIRREMLQERARVARLERARAEATVVAPFAGSVVERYLSPGALGRTGPPGGAAGDAGASPACASPCRKRAAASMLARRAVTIRLSSPAATCVGRVSGLSPEVDDASGMIYATAALVAEPDRAATQRAKLATGVVARVFLAG